MKKPKLRFLYVLALLLCLTLCIQFLLPQEEANSAVVPLPTGEPIHTTMPPLTPSPVPTELPTAAPTETPDTTAPIIEGVTLLTVSLGDAVSYRKGITVSDDSGESISLQIDNSAVILDEIGIYPVIYSAKDSSGNETRVETTLSILEPSGVDVAYVISLADQVIAEQTTEDMSLWDKVYTLWSWCHKNIQYSYASGSRSSAYAGAYEGLHHRKGDCYAYYATFSVLLDRLGVENLCVAREGGQGNHWWNLVNLGDGWYHCDSSPRKREHRYKCFMQTDAQLMEYQNFYVEHPGYYSFDASLYPERETTPVFEGNPTGVRPAPAPTPIPEPAIPIP